ncbi:MAG: WXG100 family type VII secretion target [Oscillochloridaceae bacterium umkhey_bin13]
MTIEIIQADYAQLSQIAARFGNAATIHSQLLQRLKNCVSQLEAGGWLGLGAQAFFHEMHSEVLPAQRRLIAALELADRTTIEISALMAEAECEAANFDWGGGSHLNAEEHNAATSDPESPGGGAVKWPSYPDTPKQMADLIKLLNSDEHGPITIIRNGDGEYLILLKGTNADVLNDPGGEWMKHLGLGNNYLSATTASFENASAFERQVRAAIEANVPPGSTIHFVGHSQGGIVAHNLTDNADFRDRYTIESVTTVGTPQSAPLRSDVEYHRFVNKGDPVPWLDGGLVRGFLKPPTDLPGQLMERFSQAPLNSGHSGIEAHDTKNYIQALEGSGHKLPANIDFSKWEQATVVTSIDTTIERPGWANTPFWHFTDTAFEVVRTVPMVIVNQVTEHYSQWLSPGLRDQVDRYVDRFDNMIASIPPPSRIIEQLGQGWNNVQNFFWRR